MAIGLLPPAKDARVELCGNTALAGCELMLIDQDGGEAVRQEIARTIVINMSGFAGYEEAFVEHLFMRPWKTEGGLHA